MIEQLIRDFSACTQVEAIALGGSRAGENYDEKSDYDVYVYCNGSIPEKKRHEILSGYCTIMEIGNYFWECEDNCILTNGVDIDIIYRNLDEFLVGIEEVVGQYQARNGYTTCMWHNLLNCKILYDEKKRLEEAKAKYSVSYPETLKRNIIERNMKLLRKSLPAYETQIKKAVLRKDLVSINHRTAEFLASYFDIIFAVNEMTHPGEKRLIEICRNQCRYLPEKFEENLERLFSDMFVNTDQVPADIDRMITALEIAKEKGTWSLQNIF